MGIELAKAYVTVGADTSSVVPSIRAAQPGIVGAIGGLGNAIRGALAAAGIGITIHKLFGELRQAVELSTRQIEAEQRLAAMLQATGGAVGYTAGQLRAYASELQTVTTYGDEAILEGMTGLLRFRNVAGETFKAATAAALDMAAATGTDLRSAMFTLGMALENPAVGMMRLRRAGVMLTEEQREHIAALVESGQMHKAQVMLLAAVQQRFGGVARAMAATDPGRIKQINNAIGDIKENIGRALLPMLRQWKEMMLAVWQTVDRALPHVQAGLLLVGEGFKNVFEHVVGVGERLQSI